MGQCNNCFSGKSNRELEIASRSKATKLSHGLTVSRVHRQESGIDSGHSSAESLSPNRDSIHQRCSQSSESSGKFSFRGSLSSPGDPEAYHNKYLFSDSHPKSIFKRNHSEDLPVFVENGEASEDELEGHVVKEPSIRRSRGSFSSVSSMGHFFFRSKTLKLSKASDESSISSMKAIKRAPRRTVSLKLPRSRHRKDLETKVPTVYVEDEECFKDGGNSQKSSGRKALSLLSLNSVGRYSSKSSRKSQKPVQRILRHPTKRHTTVRGISGLAIDIRTQTGYNTGLHRAHTMVYYPTSRSYRAPLGSTCSNIVYS